MGAGSSKAQFREAVAALHAADLPPDDQQFWSALWLLSTTPKDVFELISPQDVRQLLREHPQNIGTLINQAVTQLYQIVESPNPLSFDRALNCIRVLTRLMPFLLETYSHPENGEVDPFLEQLFWGSVPLNDEEEAKSASQQGEPPGGAKRVGPLGSVLVECVMRLMFLPQFTASTGEPQTSRPGDEGYDALQVHQPSLCWSGGLSFTRGARIAQGRWLESNRMEVMRLLLVLLCEPLFQKSDSLDLPQSRFAQEATKYETPHAAEFFVSLLSCVLGFDPVGWGVPFGSQMVSDTPTRQMDMAAQLLVVLLDSGRPALPTVVGQAGDGSTNEAGPLTQMDAPQPGQAGYNVYRHMLLQMIRAEEDLQFVYRGFSRLLNNVHQSRNTYIPGGTMTVNAYQELLVLMWKFVEENPTFTSYLLTPACDVNTLLVPVCYLLLEHRKDVSKRGMMHINTFVLLRLSGERNFGVALNKPFATKIPVDLPLFTGTHTDLLIVTLHKLVVSGLDRLSSLYHCFLTIICNVSPYCKSMSLVASVKLVNLFELFTSPRFLYAAETNHFYVSLLLEIFNNLIQYQYAGNQHLIYAIVRRKEAFERLHNLSLPAAIQAAQDNAAALEGAQGVHIRASMIDTKEGPEDGAPALPASPSRSPKTQEVQGSAGDAHGTGSAPGDEASQDQSADGEGVVRRVSTARVGLPRFVPSQEWLDQVKAELPLTTIMRLLQYLVPQVNDMCQRTHNVDEAAVVEFLRSTTMVGLLPVPHPIVIRKYQPNQYTALWFTAYMWGVIFVRNQEMPLFDGEKISLFTVTTQG